MTTKTLAVVFSLSLVLAVGCGKDSGGGGEGSGAAAEGGGDKGGDKKGAKKGGKKKKGKYAGGEVKGGGTITGTVSYAGDKADGSVKVTKDTAVCGNADLPKQAIENTGGKIANAIVRIDGIKEGKAFDAGEVVVDNIKCMFVPRIAVAHVGDQIVAKNSDAVLHNTHGYLLPKKKNLFNVALPQKDQTVKKKLKKAGLIDIKCDAHEWMQSYLYVSQHPYITTTDKDGKFTLADVPAGEYTLKIWHEELGEKDATAKVDAGGTATVDVTL